MAQRRHLLVQHRERLGLGQEELAEKLGTDRVTVSRWERGAVTPRLYWRRRLAEFFRVELAVVESWLTAPDHSPVRQAGEIDGADSEMMRRDFLRVAAVTTALFGVSEAVESDDPASLPGHRLTNEYLWRVYARTPAKSALLPAASQRVIDIQTALKDRQGGVPVRGLAAVYSDVLQLAGEVAFDGSNFAEAESVYVLAARAAQDARAWDLWACALIRHALTNCAEQRYTEAGDLLEAAASIARRGDSSLSTKYWVAAVHAEVYARAGQTAACQRALDAAQEVQHLHGDIHNGGWLRFDGGRLAEERGTCYVHLGMYEQAEEALTLAAAQTLSPRRRAAVLTDLALLGVRRGDHDQIRHYVTEVLDLASHTDSGYIRGKLTELRQPLRSRGTDPHLSDLYDQITAVTPATP